MKNWADSFFLAYKELRRHAVRTLLCVCITGAVLALMLVFQGFENGVYRDLAVFPNNLEAPLIVLEEGVKSLTLSRSKLPGASRAIVEGVEGVQTAHPLASLPVILNIKKRRTPIQLMVYESLGGPRKLVRGRAPVTDHDIVLDDRLARFLKLKLEDNIKVRGYDFTLVGTTAETVSPFAPYAYIRYDALLELYFSRGNTFSPDQTVFLSALLLELDPGAGVREVMLRLRKSLKGMAVFTRESIAQYDADMGKRLLGPALKLLVGISWVVALLTISLLMHSITVGRIAEFGMQKALGVPYGATWLGLTFEALMLVGLGFPVALALAGVVAFFVQHLSPLYSIAAWEPSVMIRTGLVAIAAAILGALQPAYRVQKLEPDLVFRGHA